MQDIRADDAVRHSGQGALDGHVPSARPGATQRAALGRGATGRDARGGPRTVAAVPWCAALAAATVLAYGLLVRTGLSIDEAWSVSIADRPFANVLHVIVGRERNMALYFVLLHFWVAISDDPRWLGVLSAVPAVAAVLSVGWVGRLVGGPRVAAVASLLTAANATLAGYGIQLRGYSLDVLLATLSAGCFLELLRTGRRRWATAFVAVVVAFTATTVLSALMVLALGIVALSRREGRRAVVIVTFAVLGALIIPTDLFVILTDQGNVSWIPPTTVAGLASAAVVLGGGKVGLVMAAVAVVGLAVQVARSLHRGVSAPVLVVLAWFAVPVVGLLAFSVAEPLLVPRYVLFVVPAIGLAAGCLLAPVRGGVLVGAGAALVLALTGLSTPWAAQDTDVAGGAAFILHDQRPGDAVVYDPAAARAWFGHYLGTWASTRERPRDLALAAGESPWDRGDTYGTEVSSATIARRASRVRRLWVVSYPDWGDKRLTPEPFRAVERQVLAGRHVAERWRAGDEVVTLYVKG